MLAVSPDSIVEGVAFRMEKLAPEWVGRKALAVSLSDMAAMGAKPVGFVVAVGMPRKVSEKWLMLFQRGMMGLARAYSTPCLGGDISRAKQFFSAVTVFGEAGPAGVVLRKTARIGDWIGVTGSLGGSILNHHYRFSPRVQEGMFLAARFRPHAMIDISDGLLQDLGHVLRSSNAGAELDFAHIPVSRDAKRLSKKRKELAYERALTDGEDFELLFTLAPARAKKLSLEWNKYFPRVRLSWIGKIIRGAETIRWTQNGRVVPAPQLKKKGFEHF
jgi:thiamine-monophosphate kinase